MRYIGIDPGNNGAIDFLEATNGIHRINDAVNMPTMREQVKTGGKVRTEPDFDELLSIVGEIKAYKPQLITLEMQWAQPQDSSMTAFALGGWYKMLRYALLDLPYQLTPPAQWKQWKSWDRWALWGAGDDAKAISIQMTREIFPDDFDEKICPLRKGSTTRRNKPHDGRADAALIGLWGYHAFTGESFSLPARSVSVPRIPAGVLVDF